MSELHIEISELIAAKVNVYDPEETLRVATARGYQLVVRVIEHDPKRFLTMVANLIGQSQVALSRERSAQDYEEVLQSNLEELERLRGIVADMLFLARAEQGGMPPEVMPSLFRISISSLTCSQLSTFALPMMLPAASFRSIIGADRSGSNSALSTDPSSPMMRTILCVS